MGMNRRKILSMAAAPAALGAAELLSVGAKAADTAKTFQVVFELVPPEPDKWVSVVHNVVNLRRALGPENVAVEVVFHGPGIAGATKAKNTAMEAQFAELAKGGVVFAACHNSMHAEHLTPADLLPMFVVVPSGVAEVVKKQHDGWQYLKAAW